MITDELEGELRSAFAKTADSITVPQLTRQRLLQRDYHPRTGHRGLAASVAAAVIAAAGIALPLATGGSSPPAAAGPVIQLAAHTFRLPAGYKLTATTSPSCPGLVGRVVPASLLTHRGVITRTTFSSQVTTAVSASGGSCIFGLLSPRYTPPAAKPDPEIPATAHPVRVGRYQGFLFHTVMFAHYGRTVRLKYTELFVQLPAGGNQVRQLIFGAWHLSDTAMIKIAADGLRS